MPDVDLTFNTEKGATIARGKLIAYINTGASAEMPTWTPIGIRVEDSAEELDWQRESKKDIMDNTFSTMKNPIITQSFDPWPLTAGDKAQELLWNLAIRKQDAQALANQDMLIVHMYAGTADSAVFAERYSGCAVELTKLGGAGGGSVDSGVSVTYGGTRTIGTAAVSEGAVTFSPAK